MTYAPILNHSTCSVHSQVCVAQESTMEPDTVPPETASLANENIISDGDEDNSKYKINSSKFDNRTPNVLRMAKDYVMVMLNYCVPNALDFTCSFCHISNIHKDHERFLVK